MLARLPLRSKLLLVASIPLFVLILFTGVALSNAYSSISASDDDASLFVPFRALTLVAQAAVDERIGAAWYQHIPDDGPPASDTLMLDTRDAMDVAVDRLDAATSNLDGRASTEAQDAVRTVLLNLNGLNAARARINLHEDPGSVYQEVQENAVAAAELLVRDFQDGDLASGSRAVLDLTRQQLALGDEARLVLEHLAGDTTPELATWVAVITDQRAQQNRFSADADAPQRAAFAATAASRPARDPVRGDSPLFLPTKLPAANQLDPERYADWYANREAALGAGTSAVVSKVDEAFSDARSSTRTVALQLGIGAALAIVLVIALSYAVARSVTRPIRALTRGARDMAERRLPRLVDTLRRGGELTSDQLEGFTPIKVESRDEVAELAKAFNTVQQVTVAVAEQQSQLLRKGIGDLYVNLARRNQSLLDRQIGLLDDMEARVEEPEELGSLFELDHLATRMRRNAESLLVLSGAEQPRQWRGAVPVLDVARGAAAEIADFARVTYFGFDDDVAVSGNAVADVSHLLAELLENAATFSPPSAPVVVAGRRVDRRFVITITDEGIGMDDDRLAAANALLARPPAAGLSLSRTLGLYVVAHLARRHGIHVQLRRSPGTGLTAVVGLPTGVLARVDGDRPPARPAAAPSPPTYVAEPVDLGPAPTPSRPSASPTAPPSGAPPIAERDSGRPEPAPAFAWRVEVSEDALLRRGGPAGAGNGGSGAAGGNGTNGGHGATGGAGVDGTRDLPARTPGANLSEAPGERSATAASAARPRPERVAELLQRHERGKREGRARPKEDDR
jgi:signal transduction histidine kinase